MVKDLVCGMEVDEKTEGHKAEYMGKTYYFCCLMCKGRFEEDPRKYVEI
jgi:Cu+-exporting ATPase